MAAGPRLIFPGGVTRQQAGTYICQAANLHGVMQVGARLEVVFPPSCQIQLRETATTFTLRCRAEGNPGDFSFSWLKNNLSFSDQNQITLKENSNFGKYPKRNVEKLKISDIFTCESSGSVKCCDV